MSFTITPVATATAETLRAEIVAGSLDAQHVVLDAPGAPCRHCLEPGNVGEAMLLLTYHPFKGNGPYAVPSPIFLHAHPCSRYAPTSEIPALVRSGLRAVRSYDAGDGLLDGDVVPGATIEATIDRLFEDDRADYLHVYSATAGCFTCRVDRSLS